MSTSGIRRRKGGGVPEKLMQAAAEVSSTVDPAADVPVAYKAGASWLEVHQWGLVPLFITLAACACAVRAEAQGLAASAELEGRRPCA